MLYDGDRVHSVVSSHDGGFTFTGIRPGIYELHFYRSRFFKEHAHGYRIQSGLFANYPPISLEECPAGNCDPSVRKKEIVICE